MLEIQKFIAEHPEDYKEILKNDYFITTKEDNGLLLFKYNQIKSNFNIKMVRECRGIILDELTNDIVCRPFEKFANYGESFADVIDWNSASVRSKEDGSLIKVFYYKNNWRIATNGTINAFKADLIAPFYAEEWNLPIDSFGTLFLYILSERYNIKDWSFLKGCENETHMFELCSFANKVVVKYDKPSVFYLASKNNNTGGERYSYNIDTKIPVPEYYSLKSLDDCIEMAETFGVGHEGFVVTDRYLNRIKIKSPLYVHLHHMKGEVFTHKRALDVIRAGETEELLTYFPEFSAVINVIEKRYNKFICDAKEYIKYLSNLSDEIKKDRKKFAKQVISSPYSDLAFKWLDGKLSSVDDYYKNTNTDKLLGMIS